MFFFSRTILQSQLVCITTRVCVLQTKSARTAAADSKPGRSTASSSSIPPPDDDIIVDLTEDDVTPVCTGSQKFACTCTCTVDTFIHKSVSIQ